MSKFSKILGSVTKLLGFGAPSINIPKAEIPATPAAVPQDNAGANIILGTPVNNTRVSGSTVNAKKKVDPLGLLGLGGLSF